MKLILCTIWLLISAAIFEKSLDSESFEWLALPSCLSCILGIIVWIAEFIIHFISLLQ